MKELLIFALALAPILSHSAEAVVAAAAVEAAAVAAPADGPERPWEDEKPPPSMDDDGGPRARMHHAHPQAHRCHEQVHTHTQDELQHSQSGLCAWSPLIGYALFFSLGGLLVAIAVLCDFFIAKLRHHKNETKLMTDFIDNVSHELKTPLAGIRLSAELLTQGRIPDEARRQRALKAILNESDRLSRMVAQLLDFGRLEKHNRHYNIAPFDVTSNLATLRDNPIAAEMTQSRLRVEPCNETLIAAAEDDATHQIIFNLIENAVKYSSDVIEVSAFRRENGMIAIAVADRGPGVAKNDEERVFDRFYRGDNTLTRSIGGSGLGLAIARALARGMAGDIEYSRRPGGGSIFTLTLPPAGV